tara:strand:- start:587 stop:808 length:222 start_codon:yes stop_codon:yes gene_type:complete
MNYIKEKRLFYELNQNELAEMIQHNLKQWNSKRNSTQKRISDLEKLNVNDLRDAMYLSEWQSIEEVFNTLKKG